MSSLRITVQLLLFFFASTISCYGISDSAVSVNRLCQKLDATNEDTAKINLLNALSVSYNTINLDTALLYAQRALDLAKAINWPAGVAKAYDNLGLNYLDKGEYNTALINYKCEQRIYEIAHRSPALVQAFKNIGEVYFRLNKYPQALEYYYKAMNIAERNKLHIEEAKCLINIGNIFKSERNYETAIGYIEKSKLIFMQERSMELLAVADLFLGDIFFEQGQQDSSMIYYKNALEIAKSVSDSRSIAKVLENMGNVYSVQNKTDLALDYQFKALSLYKELDDKSRIGGILGNIGTTYLLIGQTEIEAGKTSGKANIVKGVSYLSEAIPMLRLLREYSFLPQFYENMSDGYAMLGKYKLALESHQQFMLYRDSVNNQQKSKEIAGMELEYEFAKQKDSIKYDKILAEQKLVVEQKSRRIQQFLYTLGIVLVGIIAVIIFRSLRTQQKLNRKISQLVNEQEVVIEQRTADLSISNTKLRDLISFNAHQIREPLTRITGILHIRDMIERDEYFNDILPQMEKAATDLDNAIKDVLNKAQL